MAPPAPPKQRLSGLPLLIVALVVVLLVQAAFVFSYVGALHSPKAHAVSIAVVGKSPLPVAVAKQFSLRITPYPDAASAQSAINKRKVYGAFVSSPGATTLYVVPAAGAPVASALTTAFTAAGTT
jgi:hypothetical protein